MEKMIKLWKDECLPRGPKSPQSTTPVGEGPLPLLWGSATNGAGLIQMR